MSGPRALGPARNREWLKEKKQQRRAACIPIIVLGVPRAEKTNLVFVVMAGNLNVTAEAASAHSKAAHYGQVHGAYMMWLAISRSAAIVARVMLPASPSRWEASV